MSVSVWRIAVEAPAYPANDLTGTGAKISGGRWNSPGTPMVYCCSSIALAVLETLTYLRTGSLPFDRFLVRIDITDATWQKREQLSVPAGWDAVPAGITSRKAGDAWVSSGRSPLLVVPSVIVPDESNILINPLHADARAITAKTMKKWIYDPRLV